MTGKTGAQHIEPIAHLVPELKSLLSDRQWDVLKELLVDISPIDLADSWYQFTHEEQETIFRLLDPKAALIFFEALSPDGQMRLFKTAESDSLAPVLEEMPTKDIAEIFHRLPKRTVRRMMTLVKGYDAVEKIKTAMQYAPGSAGALMHPEFIRLTPRMTTHLALRLIQNITRNDNKELLRSLFVVGADGTVIGGLALEDLVASPSDLAISDLMTSVEPIKVLPETDQERVAALFSKFNMLSTPVVDANDRLLGVIHIDDILNVINAEATEDIAKMAGTTAEEFRDRSVFRIAWYRAPWLFATLVTQVVVSFVMRHFNFVLQEYIALATFLPLVAAMGGNVGSQSAMIFVRSLALGRLKGRAKYFAVLREAATGCMLGLFYGTLVAGIAYLLYGQQYGLNFVLVVGCSVWIAMMWASIAGAAGPIVFEKIGADPATAMGPMVTTTTDLFSITVYFVLAMQLLMRT